MACRRVFGEESPSTLLVMGNLAAALNELGRRSEAEALQRQVWTARRRLLGDEHPKTLRSGGNLASMLAELGRTAEAEALQSQVTLAMTRLAPAGIPPTPELIGYLGTVGGLRLKLDRAESAYLAYAQAAEGLRARYQDRRASGAGDDARTALSRNRSVFQGQIAAGWLWAHQP